MKKDKTMKKVGAPYGNKNAEKWTLRKSIQLFKDAIELTNAKHTEIITNKQGEVSNEVEIFTYDFIGEIARELGTYHQVFRDLSARFPSLLRLQKELFNNIESNCYFNTKKGNIREATGIVNLKSNWKWTDRTQIDANVETKDLTGITFEK